MDKKKFLKELNRKSYEVIARVFDKTRQNLWTELVELADSVTEGDRVADLGCGNGRLLKALPKVNFDYIGIDNDPFLISRARQEFPGRLFKIGDLENLELELASYDKIFCIATFHHLVDREDRLAFLQKCHDALKPGGELLMTVWNLWQSKYIRYFFKSPLQKLSWNDFFIPWKASGVPVWRYYHGFTKRELQKLLRAAHYSRIEVENSYGMKHSGGDVYQVKRSIVVRAVK